MEQSSEGDSLCCEDANEHVLWARLRDLITFGFQEKGMRNEERVGWGGCDGWMGRQNGWVE